MGQSDLNTVEHHMARVKRDKVNREISSELLSLLSF